MDNKKINARFDIIENLIHGLSKSLVTRYKELDNKLTEVVQSQSFLNTQFENIVKRLDKVEEEKTNLIKENKNLKEHVLNSVNEINILKEDMNNAEQYSRRDCLEIRGIPKQDTEFVEVINNVIRKIGVVVQDQDISVSHRLPRRRASSTSGATNISSPIIVKFISRTLRDKYYHAKRMLRNVTLEDLGYNLPSKIYIAESLTAKSKELFHHCLQAKKEKELKFIWTNMGKMYMRKDEHTSAIHIPSLQVLDQLAR